MANSAFDQSALLDQIAAQMIAQLSSLFENIHPTSLQPIKKFTSEKTGSYAYVLYGSNGMPLDVGVLLESMGKRERNTLASEIDTLVQKGIITGYRTVEVGSEAMAQQIAGLFRELFQAALPLATGAAPSSFAPALSVKQRRRGRPKKAASATSAPAKKRGRGRPKKSKTAGATSTTKRGRGRPRKSETALATITEKRGPGRPPKSQAATATPTKKRGRGRPRKAESATTASAAVAPAKKRGRGRPRKSETIVNTTTKKRGRGRPRKSETAAGKRGPGRPRKSA